MSKQNPWIVSGALGIIGISAGVAAATHDNASNQPATTPGITIDGLSADSDLVPLRWSPAEVCPS